MFDRCLEVCGATGGRWEWDVDDDERVGVFTGVNIDGLLFERAGVGVIIRCSQVERPEFYGVVN